MSHAQPGYVLSRQVPPRSSAFSRMTKSSHPACRSLIPIHSPANPAPMITTSVIPTKVTGRSLRWEWLLQPVQDFAGVRDDQGPGVVLEGGQVDARRIQVAEVGAPDDVLRD